jgi:hypothetical protein
MVVQVLGLQVLVQVMDNVQVVNNILLAEVVVVLIVHFQQVELVVLVVEELEEEIVLEQLEQLTLAVAVEDHNPLLQVQELAVQVALV